ncbi:hypothetical protein Tco_1437341, partial [Tanacetum coccineum]
MAKGQPKKKKAKKDMFTVYFKYDGIFTSWPLKYTQGQMKEVYYFQTGANLGVGIREIKLDQDIVDMLKVGYDNGNEIDMYVENFGYDIMELAELDRNQEQNHNSIESSDDDYYSSDDCEELENVDFQTEGDESVVIKNISTEDPFLDKLCSARIMFRGSAKHHETKTPLVDLDDSQMDYVNKVQRGLWYMKNDWREVLVYCGRNVGEGRCACKKGNKDRVMPNKVRSGVQKAVKKKVVKNKVVKKKVVKKKVVKKKAVSKYRNYNLGSLVTYKWIALQYFKEIIEDPFMPLRKMRDDIRQKFMIDGELLTSMGKDANNQMYLIAWAIVRVENAENWGWFLHLLHDDLSLNDGNRITIISNSHKMDMRCASFENGIFESFNRAILGRHKPIITMLEEIMLYIMQRLVPMNKIAFNLEDRITPSIRKRLEILKEKQREWHIFPSGFQELEVRKGDHSYGVNLQHK